jgi:hypothetical protein
VLKEAVQAHPKDFGPKGVELGDALQDAFEKFDPKTIDHGKKMQGQVDTAKEANRVRHEIYDEQARNQESDQGNLRERTDTAQKAIERNKQEDPNGLVKGAADKLMAEFQAAAKAEKELYQRGVEARKSARQDFEPEDKRKSEQEEESRGIAARSRFDQTDDYARQEQRKRDEPRVDAYAKGMPGQRVLADVAMGKETDKGALTKNIGDSMRKSGSPEEDIAKDAGRFADLVIQKVTGSNATKLSRNLLVGQLFT